MLRICSLDESDYFDRDITQLVKTKGHRVWQMIKVGGFNSE